MGRTPANRLAADRTPADREPSQRTPADQTPRVSVESITVRAGRLVCEVAVSPPGAQSTPALMRALLRRFPHVAHHACVNEVGDSFADVMDRTPLPHVLEHLAVDLQAHAAAESDGRPAGEKGPIYVGTTEWADPKKTHARVELSFTDDLMALRAVRDAAAALNEALATVQKPSVTFGKPSEGPRKPVV